MTNAMTNWSKSLPVVGAVPCAANSSTPWKPMLVTMWHYCLFNYIDPELSCMLIDVFHQ